MHVATFTAQFTAYRLIFSLQSGIEMQSSGESNRWPPAGRGARMDAYNVHPTSAGLRSGVRGGPTSGQVLRGPGFRGRQNRQPHRQKVAHHRPETASGVSLYRCGSQVGKFHFLVASERAAREFQVRVSRICNDRHRYDRSTSAIGLPQRPGRSRGFARYHCHYG